MNRKEEIGELIGTFILVFIGCSSVAGAVLLDTFSSLLEVAFIWGIGITIAIYVAGKFGPAHLNPAVSLAIFIDNRISFKSLLQYTLFQIIGAMLASILVYLIFEPSISTYETQNQIVRGTSDSHVSAVMFGEFFPNPSFINEIGELNWLSAMFLEAIGTFILLMMIFIVSKKPSQYKLKVPVIIGLTVAILIYFIAPYTQAGLNPARDFGPRLIAYFSGWGTEAFPAAPFSFFTVYILGPYIGGFLAVKFKNLIKL